MNLFYPEHKMILEALNACEIRYLLIGGYAVIAYGYGRTTGDLDIWIDPSDVNKKNLLVAFHGLGIMQEDIDLLEKMDFNEATVFSFGEVPQKIDFLTKISQVNFAEAYDNKTVIEFEGLLLPFIRYQDLILSKIASGRTKDKADIEELQRIQEYRKKD
ncbi:MAG TPA: hypothetical protein PK006_00925 [Saprospiraceae bacterium]|nr:hypothetical protein [Saprospiraceae bacterium]